jgi:acetoacetate decarboxylase
MKESDVRARAFAMPLTSPAFPPGPYRFRQREYLIIAYRTDPDKLRALVPEPLEVDEPVVKYEFIRMPDSTGFGDYTETGQVIPVSFRGRKGGYRYYSTSSDPRAAVDMRYDLQKEIRRLERGLDGSVEILSATHIIADLTLGLGKIIYDYLH